MHYCYPPNHDPNGNRVQVDEPLTLDVLFGDAKQSMQDLLTEYEENH